MLNQAVPAEAHEGLVPLQWPQMRCKKFFRGRSINDQREIFNRFLPGVRGRENEVHIVERQIHIIPVSELVEGFFERRLKAQAIYLPRLRTLLLAFRSGLSFCREAI